MLLNMRRKLHLAIVSSILVRRATRVFFGCCFYLQVEHIKSGSVGRYANEVHGRVFNIQKVLEERLHMIVFHADTAFGAQERVFVLVPYVC